MLLVRTKIGPSEIHGVGVIADQCIPKGTITWVFHHGFDREIDPEEIKKLPPHLEEKLNHISYISSKTGKAVLCVDEAKYMNHSDDANTRGEWTEETEGCDIAVRDIQVGEEICCNYLQFDVPSINEGAPV